MNQPYEDPKSEVDSDADVIRKRKFWRRAIWISIGGVIIPPLFGLVGTVIGMVGAFNQLAETGEAEPEELAGNVSVALLTTMWGLVFSTIAFCVLIGALIRFFTLPRLPVSELSVEKAG